MANNQKNNEIRCSIMKALIDKMGQQARRIAELEQEVTALRRDNAERLFKQGDRP